MNLERRIELQIAGLTVVGGVLFGMGESHPAVPAGLSLAAFLATRRAGDQPRFWLPVPAVNGLIFVIALASAWRFAFAYGTGEVIVAGHAACGLQAVLLFERRTARTLWDLLSLSLLTVFLSTALVQGPLFAPGLAGYVFLAFSTLASICVERERLASACGATGAPVVAAMGRVRGSWWRLLGIAFSTLIVGPLALFLRFPERSARAVDQREPARGGDEDGGAGVFAEPARWEAGATGMSETASLGREFWWRTGRMTAAVFAVAVVIFCLAPRFGRVEFELPPMRDIAWRGGRPQPMRVVGFTDRVRLGEMGSLSEDQRMVFEFALTDGSGQRPFRPQGSIYVRGAALTEYRAGHWEFLQGGTMGELRWLHLESSANPNLFVRQRITVEPSDRREIFCVWPFLMIEDDPPVRFDSRSERLWRRRDMLGRSFTFELATSAFHDGVQSVLTPCDRPVDETIHLRWPEEAMPELARLARRWIEESRIPADDPTARARWLQRRILDSGRFRYTFQEKRRDAQADPIEDFVTRNPEGNCEYFASVLALMLRTQGIPARLVVGFRADEYSEWTETYRVRQAHAHAWVEAYIPAARLPTGTVRSDGISDWSHGGWLRLDPTPSFSGTPSGVARQVEDWLSLLHSFWRDHVLSMSGTRQREALYRPLVLQIRQAAAELADPGAGTAEGAGLLVQLGAWILGLVFGGGAVALGVWLFREPWRRGARQRRARGPRREARGPGTAVAFYARWEALLARCGHVRGPSQTQREFAAQAAQRLAATSGDHRMCEWAGQIIQAFYEVRFGAGKLDEDRAAVVETALQGFQQAACGHAK
jgi:transglutaminase-like putative cysteine protease